MRRPRRNHNSGFKAKVALQAIKGEQTPADLAQKFDVHATQIAAWKAELLKGAANVFDDGKPTAEEKVDINRHKSVYVIREIVYVVSTSMSEYALWTLASRKMQK